MTVCPLTVTADSTSTGFDFLLLKSSDTDLTSLPRSSGKRTFHTIFNIRIGFQYGQSHQIAIVTMVSGIAMAAMSQASFDTRIEPLGFVCTNCVEKKFLRRQWKVQHR